MLTVFEAIALFLLGVAVSQAIESLTRRKWEREIDKAMAELRSLSCTRVLRDSAVTVLIIGRREWRIIMNKKGGPVQHPIEESDAMEAKLLVTDDLHKADWFDPLRLDEDVPAPVREYVTSFVTKIKDFHLDNITSSLL